MSIRANLIAARALIAPIENWAQEHFALDADGTAVMATDPTAKCFCSLGAVQKIKGAAVNNSAEKDVLNDAAQQIHGYYWGIVAVNDEVGHAAVIQVFDKAIEIAPN